MSEQEKIVYTVHVAVPIVEFGHSVLIPYHQAAALPVRFLPS